MNLKKELGGVADAVTKIMDEALKGDQHKIDANKNNKIDAHDFKLLRSKKKVEEEAEQIDELSKNTLRSYLKGSKAEAGSQLRGDVSDKAASLGRTQQDKDDGRYEGGRLAKRKLGAPGSIPAKVMAKEEVELTQDEAEMLASLSQEEFNSLTEEEQDLFIEYFQPLDEISTGAAKNYLKKAVSSSSKLNQKSAKPGEAEAEKYNYSHENAPYETKQFEKFSKRRTGIRKAITKLASAHPDNKKLATTARQAFNKIHNANYRIGMDGAKNRPDDVKHVKQQHSIIHKAVNSMKEAAERIDEYKSTGGVYKHKGTYGTEKSLEAGYTDFDKENELAKKNLKTKKPKKYGARQNFVRSTRVNESFTSILASYKENGLKGIAEMFATEQASQEEYDKEIEKAKAKSQGKDKAEVAKASVQAVKNEQTHTKIEVIDMSDPYNIQKREIDLEESSDDYEVKQDKKDPDVHHVHYKDKKIGYVYGNKKGMFGHEYHAMGTGDDGYSSKKQAVNAVKADHKYHMSGDYLKERTLTEPEMKKKEDIVKGMKKGMKGFKERYGERAKEVMYATATKQAMKD